MLRQLARLRAVLGQGRSRPQGVVDRPGPVLPSAAVLRTQLGVPATARLVVGWVGPVDRRSGVLDLVEAAAICDDGIAVLIPAAGPDHRRVMDQADAFDLLHRIRFVPVPDHGDTGPARSGRKACPAIVAAADVLVVGSPRRRAARREVLAGLADARTRAVPVVTRGPLPDHLGTARWAVRPNDPGLLARLLTELAARPALLLPVPPVPQAAAHARTAGVPRRRFAPVPGPRVLRAWLLASGRPQTTP